MRIPAGTLITTRTLLFDMDGTLVDSTVAVERIWGGWARRRGVAFDNFRHGMHGRRSIDIMRDMAPPGVDPHEEVRLIDDAELVETEGIVPVPGATALLSTLPRASWALVTSASLELATARMTAAGLALPEVVVSAADVRQGKPHPEGYQRALQRCQCPPAEAVVFEDASAGLAAGRAAGCRVIALATTLSEERLAGEEWMADFSTMVLEDIDAQGRLLLRVR